MKTFFSMVWLSCFIILLSFLLSCFNGFFYPIKYREEIVYNSNYFNIKPALVASIINVESSYIKERVSTKGAVGLMQIMPSTAEWIAKRINEEYLSEDDLLNPQINIKFGSFYISYLIDYFKSLDSAVCAYNAGMGNVSAWLKNESYAKDGKLIKIPFKETEDYYNKILKNLRYYEKKY